MREPWTQRFVHWLTTPQVSRIAMMAGVGPAVLLVLAKVGTVKAEVGWRPGSGVW